ncbi:reverse transcriptase domain-containing protein [Tanacetum coccineum]
MPPPFINSEEDERVEETLTDPKHGEFTIKVLPPQVQKTKAPSQQNYMVHQRDPRYPHIPYPSRMNQEKRQEKDEVQIHKFWQMFKQLHINMSIADALILILKYQKMLKSLLSNKEKLIELANTPFNENCSHRILARPKGIAKDVFVLVGKFTFLADFVIVDYESGPRVPLILGRPFLRTARALIDVHVEEMILRDDIEYFLNHVPTKEIDSILEDSVDENFPDNNLVDTIYEMFTDEHALDYLSSPLWDDYDDKIFDLETVNDDTYDDPFDYKEEKIKDSKLLIDELDLPESSDFLLFPECDSLFYEDFSKVDALPSRQ